MEFADFTELPTWQFFHFMSIDHSLFSNNLTVVDSLYSWSFPLTLLASLSVICPPVTSKWSWLLLQLYLSSCVHLSSKTNAFWSSYIEHWMSLLCNYTAWGVVSTKECRQLNFRFMSFVECEFWLAIGNLQEPLPVVWSSLSYCPPWYLITDLWRPYKSFPSCLQWFSSQLSH